ncbi:MAG: hypothetical protein EPO07_09515 [Verrucomicrobia bacterium]|nr:MAG: hypothetical protein EPO07_09515 [Verrucomicrobiota bacterium]
MTKFQLSLVFDAGQIRVYARYDQDKPLFLEHVNVLELDAGGNTIGAYSTVIRDYFGPGQGGNFLFAHTPSGTNVKQIKATGCYVNIDQVAGSNTVAL